jgi:hypothetical protein
MTTITLERSATRCAIALHDDGTVDSRYYKKGNPLRLAGAELALMRILMRIPNRLQEPGVLSAALQASGINAQGKALSKLMENLRKRIEKRHIGHTGHLRGRFAIGYGFYESNKI